MARARWAGRWAMAVGAAAALAAGGARAQPPKAPGSGGSTKDADVPPSYRPPPGMCRIWLAGVPPNQQPAPTDCAAAVRNRPANGRVLFGDDYVPRKSGSAGRSGPTRLASALAVPMRPWRALPAVSPAERGPNTEDAVLPVGLPVALAESIPVAPRAVAPHSTQDEYEAGYAAGYRDAMNGRRPRFRGADRLDPGTGGAAAATGGAYGAPASGYGRPSGGGVVVVPSGEDPRYFNNGQYPPPGRANGVCLDRDGDGWCDDPRFGAPVCRDLDGDGRCDDYPALAASPFPSSLPEMRAGLDVRQGRGSAAALRWLGTSEVVARIADPKRTGTPYRVLWYDANTNVLLQAWTDLDGDGVADRVEVFRNGRRVKLLGR